MIIFNKRLCTFLFISMQSLCISAQNSTYWKEVYQYDIDSSSNFKVDGIGNIFVYENNVISKYDSIGVLKFSESSKRFGKIQSVLPVNAMKLIVFSEEQQLICSVDNTLTNYSNCLELDNFGIEYGTFTSVSNRSNNFWVYDQLNSMLLLLNINGKIEQKISNLKHTIGFNNVDYLFERNNVLYLYDASKGMFSFDLYGTLIYFDAQLDMESVVISDDNIFYLNKDLLIVYNIKSRIKKEFNSPIEGVTKIDKLGNHFYFKKGNKIFKYQLVLD